MSKITYNRVRGSKSVFVEAKSIGNVAGEKFFILRDDLSRRIQQSSAEYRHLIARARDVQIGAASSISSIAVEDILEDAKKLLDEKNQSAQIKDGSNISINVLSDVLPHCLRTVNTSDVISQHIVLSRANKTAQSIKLTNIVFNQREFAKIILDLLFFCDGFSDNSALETIEKVFYIILNLIGVISINLDDDCKNVLLAIYKHGPNRGIQEDDLIKILSDKMDESRYHKAISTLCKYHCIEVIEAHVYIIESIGFEFEQDS